MPTLISTPDADCDIFIDGCLIGRANAVQLDYSEAEVAKFARMEFSAKLTKNQLRTLNGFINPGFAAFREWASIKRTQHRRQLARRR